MLIDWGVLFMISISPIALLATSVHFSRELQVSWFLFFIDSYLPLYPILMVKSLGQEYSIFGTTLPSQEFLGFVITVPALLSLSLLSIGSIHIISLIVLGKAAGGEQKEIDIKQSITSDTTDYLLVYIFPLTILDYKSMLDLAIFFIIFALVMIIQLRSRKFVVNPLLAVIGFQLYETEVDDHEELLLSPYRLDTNQTVKKRQKYIPGGVRIITQ